MNGKKYPHTTEVHSSRYAFLRYSKLEVHFTSTSFTASFLLDLMFTHSVTVTLYQTHLRHEEKPHPATRGARPSFTQRPRAPFPPKSPCALPAAASRGSGRGGRTGTAPPQGGSQSRALRERAVAPPLPGRREVLPEGSEAADSHERHA